MMTYAEMHADYLKLIAIDRNHARWAIQALRNGYAPAAGTLARARANSHAAHAEIARLRALGAL